jgi:hypothetical protein
MEDIPRWARIPAAPLVLGIRLVESRRFRPLPQLIAWVYFSALTMALAVPFMVLL